MNDSERQLDHSQQGNLLKIQYTEDGDKLRKRNLLESDSVVFEMPIITQTKQMDNPQEENTSFSLSKLILNLNNEYPDGNWNKTQNKCIDTSEVMNAYNNSGATNSPSRFQEMDQIASFKSQHTRRHEQFSRADSNQQNNDSYLESKFSNRNVIKKEPPKRFIQTRFLNNNSNYIFEQNLLFVTRIRNSLLRYFRNYTQRGRMFFLTQHVRQKINDKSDLLEVKNNLPFFYKMVFSLLVMLDSLLPSFDVPLINPQSTIGFLFSMFFTTSNLLFFYIFSIGFVFSSGVETFFYFYQVYSLIWLVEIVSKLNTLLYLHNKVIKERKQIAFVYVKSRIIYDLIPFIQLILLSANSSLSNSHDYLSIFYKVLVCLKIKNILRDVEDIQTQFCMRVKRYYLIQLFNLIFKIIVIAHLIACFWYILGQYEEIFLNQDTWYNQFQTKLWWQLYVYSFYWAFSLMTVGSSPVTSISQALFTTITMFFTTITFAYLLNVIGMILEEMDQTEKDKRKDINIMNEYMRQKHISKDLQRQINIDLEYFYSKNIKKTNESIERAANNISPELKQKLILEYNIKILNHIEFFSKNFSADSIQQFAASLEEFHFFPNQVISCKEYKDDSILYIDQGKVEISQNKKIISNNNQFQELLQDGSYFGEINFFTGIRSEMICISRDFTKVIKLSRNRFIDIIKENEKDFEKFCQIKDNIQFYDNICELDEKCKNCESNQHSTYMCTRVFLDKQAMFQRISYVQSLKQKRSGECQRRKIKINSLHVQNNVCSVAIEFANMESIGNLDSLIQSDLGQFEEVDERFNNKSFVLDQNSNVVQNKVDQNMDEQLIKSISNIPSRLKTNKADQDSNSFVLQMSLQEKIMDDPSFYKSKNPQKFQKQISKITECETFHQMDQCSDQFKKDGSDSISGTAADKPEEGMSELLPNMIKNQERQKKKNLQQSVQLPSQNSMNRKLNLHNSLLQNFESRKFQNEDKIEFIKQFRQMMLLKHQETMDIQENTFPWSFDSLKDFKHYFVFGNSKVTLQKMQKFLMKTLQKTFRTKRKTIKKR